MNHFNYLFIRIQKRIQVTWRAVDRKVKQTSI